MQTLKAVGWKLLYFFNERKRTLRTHPLSPKRQTQTWVWVFVKCIKSFCTTTFSFGMIKLLYKGEKVGEYEGGGLNSFIYRNYLRCPSAVWQSGPAAEEQQRWPCSRGLQNYSFYSTAFLFGSVKEYVIHGSDAKNKVHGPNTFWTARQLVSCLLGTTAAICQGDTGVTGLYDPRRVSFSTIHIKFCRNIAHI